MNVTISDNKLYFTDPTYGFLKKDKFYDNEDIDKSSDLGFKGVYSL
eukprot:UN16732